MYINSIIIAPRKLKNNLLVVVVVGSVGVVGSVVVVGSSVGSSESLSQICEKVTSEFDFNELFQFTVCTVESLS